MGDGSAGRILILLPGLVDERLAGPEIRGWEIARALAETFDVSVAAGVSSEFRREGIRVVPHRRARLLREVFHHDVVMAAWLPPFLLASARLAGHLTVADLYDPIEFELEGDRRGAARELLSVRELTRLQLNFADVVTCGSGVQLERLEEGLTADARLGPGPRLVCVPFGVTRPPQPLDRPGRLRELCDSIGPDDVVALWWGSVWHWLDAETPIRAMKQLSQVEPSLKLVLSVGPPRAPEAQRLTRTEETRELAHELGLVGESVFFIEDWIPYERRFEILAEADIGIALHRDPAEAEVAVRARYLDFVWGSIPTVLTPGDELGNELVERGAAIPVNPGDVDAVANALLKLARAPEMRRSAAQAAAAIAEERRWTTVAGPLAATLREAITSEEGANRSNRGLIRATLRYYLLGARDRLWKFSRRLPLIWMSPDSSIE